MSVNESYYLNHLPLTYSFEVGILLGKIDKTSDWKEQRKLFEEFSKKFTMHINLLRLWKKLEIQNVDLFDFATMEERETYINIIASQHFYDETFLNFSFSDPYDFPVLDKVFAAYKIDKQKFHSNAKKFMLEYKKIKAVLNLPNPELEEYWNYYQANSLSPITAALEEKHQKLIKLWDKIHAHREDPVQWIQCLQEMNDHEFIVQNIEVALSKQPYTIIAWKEYISYLKTVDIMQMLNVYSRYCHFFVWDWKMREMYRLEIVKLCHKQVNVQKWIDDYNFLNKEFSISLDAHTLLHHLVKKFVTLKFKSIFNHIISFKFKLFYIPWKKKNKHKNDDISISNVPGFELSYIEYIIANANQKMLAKFYSISKWFFQKRKAPLCHRLGICDNSKTFSFEHSFFITPTDLDYDKLKNIFVTHSIVVSSKDCYALHKIIPRLFKCDAKMIKIDDQILTFGEYCFLVDEGNVEKIWFNNVSVQLKSGEKVAVEFLIERIPKAKCLEFLNAEIDPETSQKLGKIQLLNKIEHFSLGEIDETFEIRGFSEFIQNNGNAASHYNLHFKSAVPSVFKSNFSRKLKGAVDHWYPRYASQQQKPKINIY